MTHLLLKDYEFDFVTRVIMDVMLTYDVKANVLIVEDLRTNNKTEYDYCVTVSCNKKQEIEILDELKKRVNRSRASMPFPKRRRDKDVST